jgi:dTDP-4-dehydrorhamnose 3,5-epimerase
MYSVKSLERISIEAGDIRKYLKLSDSEFSGFGEIYFSYANKNFIKAWKKHNKMTMNIMVVSGEIKFVFYVDGNFKEIILKGSENKLLTVNPGIWFGFEGIGENNLICNIANIEHSEDELERKEILDLEYKWR